MLKDSTARRVLVVDDESLLRWSLRRALTALGCDVLEAGDAKSALLAASEGASSIEAVLLDLKLPDSADLGLLAKLRVRLPAARIIVMTALGSEETRSEALTLGAFRVVQKPFDVKALAAMAAESDLPR